MHTASPNLAETQQMVQTLNGLLQAMSLQEQLPFKHQRCSMHCTSCMSRQYCSHILQLIMQPANVLPHVPWYFVRHPAAMPLQCCLYCTVQPEVLELDGWLALHVHLTGKSVMMPLLRHNWSSHNATEMH